jgi:hypothetical protein
MSIIISSHSIFSKPFLIRFQLFFSFAQAFVTLLLAFFLPIMIPYVLDLPELSISFLSYKLDILFH